MEKLKKTPPKQPPRFLLFGGTGWIGGLVSELLTKEGATWRASKARLEDRATILKEVEEVRFELREMEEKKQRRAKTKKEGKKNSTPTLSSLSLSLKTKNSKNIQQFKPTHVLNAAGLTGRPNVDWCETHKVR